MNRGSEPHPSPTDDRRARRLPIARSSSAMPSNWTVAERAGAGAAVGAPRRRRRGATGLGARVRRRTENGSRCESSRRRHGREPFTQPRRSCDGVGACGARGRGACWRGSRGRVQDRTRDPRGHDDAPPATSAPRRGSYVGGSLARRPRTRRTAPARRRTHWLSASTCALESRALTRGCSDSRTFVAIVAQRPAVRTRAAVVL